MKLIRLKAEAFGPLRGEWHFSPDRVNLLVESNERGKSTLLSSLKRSANGRPPGPGRRYAVHFRQPGPGGLPSSSA